MRNIFMKSENALAFIPEIEKITMKIYHFSLLFTPLGLTQEKTDGL